MTKPMTMALGMVLIWMLISYLTSQEALVLFSPIIKALEEVTRWG